MIVYETLELMAFSLAQFHKRIMFSEIERIKIINLNFSDDFNVASVSHIKNGSETY